MMERMVPGMAHFAGTGPDWTYCHQCAHWSGKRPELSTDIVKTGRCEKAARMLRRRSLPKVRGTEFSCRHYEAAS